MVPPEREVPVAPIPAAAPPRASAAPAGAVVLPGLSLAYTADEDTTAEIAELAGDDPASPRCQGVRLELKTKKDPWGALVYVATVINGGPHPVTLVEPGDGSLAGWRTPIIAWRVTTADGRLVPREQHSRCGNMNDITEAEIFTLKPGARHVLAEWLRDPEATSGQIVRLAYDNDPRRETRAGGFFSSSTPEPVMAKIRKSTPCKLLSGPVTVP